MSLNCENPINLYLAPATQDKISSLHIIVPYPQEFRVSQLSLLVATVKHPIRKGLKTLADVPPRLREKVRAALEEGGV